MTTSDSAAGSALPLAWVPDACTLPAAQQPLRLAEFDDLFAASVRDSRRLTPTHLRLNLHGPQGLKAKVEDLAARESDCCSFFTFAVTALAEGMVQFDIEVPAAQTDVLDTLAERATTIAPSSP